MYVYMYIYIYIHMYVCVCVSAPLLVRMWQRYPMSMVCEWYDEDGNTRRIWLGGVDGATDTSKLHQWQIGCRVICGFGDHECTVDVLPPRNSKQLLNIMHGYTCV